MAKSLKTIRFVPSCSIQTPRMSTFVDQLVGSSWQPHLTGDISFINHSDQLNQLS